MQLGARAGLGTRCSGWPLLLARFAPFFHAQPSAPARLTLVPCAAPRSCVPGLTHATAHACAGMAALMPSKEAPTWFLTMKSRTPRAIGASLRSWRTGAGARTGGAQLSLSAKQADGLAGGACKAFGGRVHMQARLSGPDVWVRACVCEGALVSMPGLARARASALSLTGTWRMLAACLAGAQLSAHAQACCVGLRLRRVEGDVLVGTDGIWSKIRKQMVGDTPAHYSEYTVYTVGDEAGGRMALVLCALWEGRGSAKGAGATKARALRSRSGGAASMRVEQRRLGHRSILGAQLGSGARSPPGAPGLGLHTCLVHTRLALSRCAP